MPEPAVFVHLETITGAVIGALDNIVARPCQRHRVFADWASVKTPSGPSPCPCEGSVSVAVLSEFGERDPCRWDDLDLIGSVTLKRGLWCGPSVFGDLTVIDHHRALRGSRREEPRREPTKRPFPIHCIGPRWLPMRPRHHLALGNDQTRFFSCLACRSSTSGTQLISRIKLLGVDPAAGEHPHATERNLGVSAKRQHLKTRCSVAQQQDRGRGDERDLFRVGFLPGLVGHGGHCGGGGHRCPVRGQRNLDAYLASVDEDQPDDAADPSANGSPVGIIAIGLVIGLLIAGAVISLGRDSNNTDVTLPSTIEVPTTSANGISDNNGEAVDLVVAYGRSRTDDHALTGELLRPGQTPVAIRRAIMDGRAIDEVGATAAVTEAGETRQCELIEGQWLCAAPLPAITAELDVQGFATLLLTELPTYSVFAVSSEPPGPLSAITALGSVTCWSMVSDGRVDRARFGAETTLCFHDELGALVGRVTETSSGNDLFVAEELRSEVAQSDVEPSR